jgi:type I restriction enzyme M protein
VVLEAFLEARNEQAHGAGPRSSYEYEQKILDLEDSLNVAIEELAPLERSEWFVVDHLDWSARRETFTATGRSLRGEHPDFELWVGERHAPLESGVVYVRLGSTDLPLGGFCTLRSCSRCLHEELYYPDRLRGSMVRLRSLDRGHERDMPIEEVGIQVRSATLNPLPNGSER